MKANSGDSGVGAGRQVSRSHVVEHGDGCIVADNVTCMASYNDEVEDRYQNVVGQVDKLFVQDGLYPRVKLAHIAGTSRRRLSEALGRWSP